MYFQLENIFYFEFFVKIPIYSVLTFLFFIKRLVKQNFNLVYSSRELSPKQDIFNRKRQQLETEIFKLFAPSPFVTFFLLSTNWNFF